MNGSEDMPGPQQGDLYSLKLDSGSRVAVIGGGPAGSFFSFFLLDMAGRYGIDLSVDIYEPKDFSRPGPPGCNMCGGIISESLVQLLATEGINLPSTVVQRGIDSYVLHTDRGTVHIETPLHEKRIAAVHRGSGPRGIKEMRWRSFDGYLLDLAARRGARVIRSRVDEVSWQDGRPLVKARDGDPLTYDLVAVAAGINTTALRLFEGLGFGYRPPPATRTYICELFLGQERIRESLGNSMHVFLLDIPRLDFAALIPKGDYVTLCLLGTDIDRDLILSFLTTPEVMACFPAGWEMPGDFCHCPPWISIGGAHQPFHDRVVFVGDAGITRLYKDGIGAAYRTAKAAAKTAVFEGISTEDFRRHYQPVCNAISSDNRIGRIVFFVTHLIQKVGFVRKGVLRMAAAEQRREGGERGMSTVLWDTFTGSAPYRDVFLRTLRPSFLGRLILETLLGIGSHRPSKK